MDGQVMVEITDEYMQESLKDTKEYSFVLLKAGPKAELPGKEKIMWEHARRNFALREDGLVAIVAPVQDGSYVNGIYIFDATPAQTKKFMDEDPGVKAGLFSYEIHPCTSFPGDNLPK